jgi:hypothetical protein
MLRIMLEENEKHYFVLIMTFYCSYLGYSSNHVNMSNKEEKYVC